MSFDYRHIPVDSEAEFIDRSSAELEQAILDAIEDKGKCTIGLSGGSTPRPIYEALGKLKAIEWHKVTVFLVDERFVPDDHEESNQKMVRETLLKHASIPESQIVFPDTTLDLEECIEDYDFRIGQIIDGASRFDTPRGGGATQRDTPIDVVALGLGEDGHIASLFPGDIDAILEKDKRVIHTTTPRPRSGQALTFVVKDRITVTLPVLEDARQFFFLKGKGKKKIFAEVLSENEDPVEYPAHALLAAGKTVWITWF